MKNIFFNFQKMVYGFENHKSFFDFEHLIFKLTDLSRTSLGIALANNVFPATSGPTKRTRLGILALTEQTFLGFLRTRQSLENLALLHQLPATSSNVIPVLGFI
jgi:hypothetical protein